MLGPAIQWPALVGWYVGSTNRSACSRRFRLGIVDWPGLWSRWLGDCGLAVPQTRPLLLDGAVWLCSCCLLLVGVLELYGFLNRSL